MRATLIRLWNWVVTSPRRTHLVLAIYPITIMLFAFSIFVMIQHKMWPLVVWAVIALALAFVYFGGRLADALGQDHQYRMDILHSRLLINNEHCRTSSG